jgi:hypothetical protein
MPFKHAAMSITPEQQKPRIAVRIIELKTRIKRRMATSLCRLFKDQHAVRVTLL